MKTFVLILMILGSDYRAPVTVTNIPGYGSFDACEIAGKQWREASLTKTSDKYWAWACISGPER